jgi:hypothetical protein
MRSVVRRIRVKKEDSVFVYFILESHEGLTSYSTLDYPVGALYRDLELRMSPDFVTEVDEVLQSLGDLVVPILHSL